MAEWLTAKVVDIRVETPRAKTFRLALPSPSTHLAGQHYVLRLVAEDQPGFWEGYGYHDYGDPWREQRYWGD